MENSLYAVSHVRNRLDLRIKILAKFECDYDYEKFQGQMEFWNFARKRERTRLLGIHKSIFQ